MLVNGIPQRRCIGCMESKNQKDLVRMVMTPEGIRVDEKGNSHGRGFYICKNMDCFEKAEKRKSFNRQIKGPISAEDLNLIKEHIAKLEMNPDIGFEDMKRSNKVRGLLGFASKSRNLVTGYNTCLKLIPTGKMKLLIIAGDVGANTRKKMMEKCDTYRVPVRIFGKCEDLSAATGKEDKGLFGLTDEGFAKSIMKQIDEMKQEREVF